MNLLLDTEEKKSDYPSACGPVVPPPCAAQTHGSTHPKTLPMFPALPFDPRRLAHMWEQPLQRWAALRGARLPGGAHSLRPMRPRIKDVSGVKMCVGTLTELRMHTPRPEIEPGSSA